MWAGTVNFEAGGTLVAVEYDSDDTLVALRAACARWATDDAADVPAAFGVREAKVGFRRRRVGIVHHGAPIRHRTDSVDAAVAAVATFLAEIERGVPEGGVEIAARAFARNDRLALVDRPASIDLDERLLHRLGVAEVPTWRPLLDLTTGEVTVGGRRFHLAGVVLQGLAVTALDDARRHVWSLGTGPHLPWAEFVDGIGERIVWQVDDLASTLDHLLA